MISHRLKTTRHLLSPGSFKRSGFTGVSGSHVRCSSSFIAQEINNQKPFINPASGSVTVSCFSCGCNKIPGKSNFKKTILKIKNLTVGESVRIAKAWQKDLEAAAFGGS